MFSSKLSTQLFLLCISSTLIFGESLFNRATPNWIGVFDATNGCDQTICCCPTGTINLSPVQTTKLRVQANFDGTCPQKPLFVDSTVDMPTTFTTIISFLQEPVTVRLSDDSQRITFVNAIAPICNGDAIRKNGARLSTEINSIFFVVLTALLTLKQFVF
ncbi:unnamed protein product [Adineta ricciae]|uniref:Uncharacterized protein n=1 Tax=Adineta ricciae TaxID=249248 RepID=A0A816GCN4_ADIRI|nr:unnamed protein product [Adineta ricciae]CAF1672435.1 unnamed protein product [Adineta ricciae]